MAVLASGRISELVSTLSYAKPLPWNLKWEKANENKHHFSMIFHGCRRMAGPRGSRQIVENILQRQLGGIELEAIKIRRRKSDIVVRLDVGGGMRGYY